MLSENQVKRLLKQSEEAIRATLDNFKDKRLQGWVQALRLVLEEDTYPIKKDPIDA